ncbi:MAG: ATP-dependent RecD-like DNA helicase [Clostridia bacterium]|nr:ATP-dependent RecD-like DNA helicase [Clostridia bacterium]
MVIKGTIEKIIFTNPENGYTVVELKVGFDKITATGKFPTVDVGEILELTGEFKQNKNYGEQFVSEKVKIEKPTDLNAIIKYLEKGKLRGIGRVTARNIVNMFGEDTLKVIDKSPHLLAQVKGITLKKAQEIGECYQNIKEMQEAVMFVQQYDISNNLAIKIYEKYKQKTEQVLMENPYKLVEDIEGIGFKTADKIAMKMGIAYDSDARIKAGVVHVLSEIAEMQGSTVAYVEDLIEEVTNVLEFDESLRENIEQSITDLEIIGQVKKVTFNEQEALAISKYYHMEKFIARKLINLCANTDVVKYGTEEEVLQYEQFNNITLHEKQREAIISGTNEGVVIITGGPGTGKTTIIKGILKIFKNAKLKCMLMAPTGRAAKRLEEQTGEPASTVHRALEANFEKGGRGFFKNENNPLDCDVIIVDEVSMLDVFLTNSLLKAVNFGTRIIFVGDKDQLPSVGAGNVLSDIIQSEMFKVVELTQIFRQSEESMIVVNAHKINNSEMPDFKVKSNDFFYSPTFEPEKVADEIVSLISERMPKYFDLTSDDIQIIAPMKAGYAGVDNLNVLIQEKINPPSYDKNEFKLQKRIFREGDRVMQIINNYDRDWEKMSDYGYANYGSGVFNGDMGKIESINTDINEMYVMFDDGRRACYSYAELDEIVLSYAITIHKSQGSEFPVVIIPIMGGNPLLMNKNLLYTAVTRAKKVVVLIGKSSNIFYMIKNKSVDIRNTLLKTMLQNPNYSII